MTALERAQANADRAAENRRAMPCCTAWIDDLRAHLGHGVHVKYASENGIERGRPGEHGVAAVSFPRSQVTEKREKVKPVTRYVEQEALGL